ncbi:MAG: hypothetical protein AB7I12_04220 [Steroidobacteraceae bacterium]
MAIALPFYLVAPSGSAQNPAPSGFPAVGPQPDPYVVVEANTAGDKARAAVAFLQMAFNQKKVAEAFKLYVGPYYKQHATMVPDGAEILIKLITEHLKHDNVDYYVKRTLVDGDLVTVHSYQTQSSMAKPDVIRGFNEIDMFRFENGKIVEHWSSHEPVPEKSANANTMF